MSRAALPGVVLLLFGSPLLAQEVSVLVGGVRARYADSVSGSAGLAALQIGGSTKLTAGRLDASLSKFTTGEWVTRLSAFGAGMLPLGGGASFGVTFGGDANYVEEGVWSGEATAGLLGAVGSSGSLASFGASIGRVRTVYDSTVASAALSARVQHVLPRGLVLSGGVVGVSSDTTQYVDATVEFSLTGTRTRASLVGGVRAGDLSNGPWGQAQVQVTVAPRTALEAALGRYPRDLVGFTDGLYVTLGMRLGVARSSRVPRRSDLPVYAERLESGLVRIAVRYVGDAERLEIAGAWSGWTPLPLERESGGVWSVVLSLQPGIYRYAIVVDGENWMVPDGVPSEPDDFGGEVAILVVR